jgi:CRISPR-associated endonuclease Csn1
MNPYRLALDIGTNSIGWCTYALSDGSPVSITDAGVRVFPDGRNPKDGSSNAVERRNARAMRRNRDRFLYRRNNLIRALVASGLFPEDEAERRALTALDPYELRARGIKEALYLHELGRALFHLNQRRGFKSNRKSDKKDNEGGAIKGAIKAQKESMKAKGAATFGEFLYLLRSEGSPVRSRLKQQRMVTVKGKEKPVDYYDFYPERSMIEEEFDQLWEMQSSFHPQALTYEAREKVRHAIFFQRDLKRAIIGKCTFERDEDRAPKALPIVQHCRIYQELNHLQVLDRRSLEGRFLTLEERDTLAKLLCQPNGKKDGKSEVTFDAMRKALKVGNWAAFSHESEKRKGLDADSTSAMMSHKDRFGSVWYKMTPEEHEQVVGLILFESDEEALLQMLMENWNLDRKRAEFVGDTPLPDAYARLGMTATRKITAQLKADVIPYSEAVVRAGYSSHSQFSRAAQQERLPYYGVVLERHVIPDPVKGADAQAPLEKRYGKVGNPTVHIALNQLRKVVNEIVKLYGPPAEIHVEVLRDLKNSLEDRKKIQEAQAENQELNNRCAVRLREEFGVKVNRENIERLRLWEELGGASSICVYTNENIYAQNLFSKDIELDHILPFSRTLDDSMANKMLCKSRANQQKSNKTPFEAWGQTDKWQEILDRSIVLPKNKQWRFAENAMDKYKDEETFLARHLTDSQYIARLAREYLAVLFKPEEAHKVVCLPGRLTGIFRKYLKLGKLLQEINPSRNKMEDLLGEKNRNDNRHHAVDAMVIGLMDRKFLQKAATAHARAEREGLDKLMADWEDPWPTFREDAKQALKNIIVSHKPDHGIEDELHNKTAYSYYEGDSRGTAVHRVMAEKIGIANLLNIRNKGLRAALFSHVSGMGYFSAREKLDELDAIGGRGSKLLKDFVPEDVKAFQQIAKGFFDERGIRRVRLIETIDLVFPAKQGRFKGFRPDGNAYLDIYKLDDDVKWSGDMVRTFVANSTKIVQAENKPSVIGSRVIRLFNRDMLEVEHDGKARIFYIQKMSAREIALVEHFEANADKRSDDKLDPFKFVTKGSAEALRKSKVRFLVVTPAGKVRYLSDDPNDPQSA